MISAYAVPPLVLGMALSYVWLIHHFWLRHIFSPAGDNSPYETVELGEKAAPGATMDFGLPVPQIRVGAVLMPGAPAPMDLIHFSERATSHSISTATESAKQ